MAGCTFNAKLSHLALSDSAGQRQQRSITALNCTLAGFTNTFTDDSEQLYKLVTKAVMPEEVTYGQMLHCSVKSNLMTILESLNAGTRVEGVEEEHPNLRKEENVKEGHDACRVVLVDRSSGTRQTY